MKISKNVKRALLSSSLFSILMVSVSAFGFSIKPDMDCGVYHVRGQIGLNNNGAFIITVQPNTSSPYELILLGGSLEEKVRLVGIQVTTEVYVPKALHSQNRPYVLWQKWVSEQLPAEESVKLVQAAPCGENNRYRVGH